MPLPLPRRASDGVHHECGFGYAQARAAVVLRHGYAEPAIGGHGAVEFAREAFLFLAVDQ